MRCLLDTNVVSEGTKPSPDRDVMRWLAQQPAANTYLSVVTIGEIEQGIALLGKTTRALEYRRWLEDSLVRTYEGRILTLDRRTMRTWGRITASAISTGKSPPIIDSLLAATAITHELVFVTRDTKDVGSLPVETLDPWMTGT